MTTTEIRDALVGVQQAVEVPPVDQVAFRARLRREHRRHLAARGFVAVTAAAALAVGGVSVGHLLDRGPARSTPVASAPASSAGRGSVSETVWFVRGGRLTALDPSGTLHRTDVRAEGVVGFTSERVYAVDDDSHVVVLGREHDHEGLGRDTGYPPEASPVPGAVQSVALSADGRYLAWLDLQDTVTVFDLLAGRAAFRVDASSSAYVAGVSAAGVLLADDDGLTLRTATGQTPVPIREGDDTWGAQVAADRVLVPGASGARVFDLGSGRARLVAGLPGADAALASSAQVAATIETSRDDSAVVEVWDGEDTRRLRGLDGVPEQLRFAGVGADEDALLVVTQGGGHDLWTCSTADVSCLALPVPGGDLWLRR